MPISDIGTATFLAEDKALLFMRYIRKHLKWMEEARDVTDAIIDGGHNAGEVDDNRF